MGKNLSATKGTLAYCLAQPDNSAAIFELVDRGKLYEAKLKTLNIVDSDLDLKSNPQVNTFKAQVLKAQGKNHFISILATYMTGCKVS